MRAAVIGVGRHASSNLYPNLRPAGIELVATCARTIHNAQTAATAWGAAHAFDDAEQMLSTVDVDGVVICVQPSDYAPLVKPCLEAGVPVFCDKPGAATAEEALELADLSDATGVPIVVGYMKRFAPAYQRAREIITRTEFGRPSMATFTFAMGQGFGGDLRTYLIDNPVHHFDIARYLLGELQELQAKVTEVRGFGHGVGAVARAASGAVCTFNFSTTASWEQRNEFVEIYGEGHAVRVENVDTCTYRPPQRPEHVWRPNYTVPAVSNSSATIMGFAPELEHFRDVAMREAPSASDMRSAATTLALAEQLCDIASV